MLVTLRGQRVKMFSCTVFFTPSPHVTTLLSTLMIKSLNRLEFMSKQINGYKCICLVYFSGARKEKCLLLDRN